MKKMITLVLALMMVMLAACGGGGTSGGGSFGSGGDGGGSGGGAGGIGTSCTYTSRAQFVRDTMNEWYLFPELLDTAVNPAGFTGLQAYIDALVARAAAEKKDRGFSYITSIAEENAHLQQLASAE